MTSLHSGTPLCSGELRPSAVEGWLLLTRQLAAIPHETISDAVVRLQASYATRGFDYEVAAKIMATAGPAHHDVATAYRQIIELMAVRATVWLPALPRGRHALQEALSPDGRECFRRAGVFDDPPSVEVVAFLDRLANRVRAAANLPLVESSREAERMSFDREVSLSDREAGAPAVEWVALNDNSAGYDILSSRWWGGRWARKLIEVKSCRGHPLRFILSRNEYETARRHPGAYLVHLWDMHCRQLHELAWPELEMHMPSDHGEGCWDSVTVKATWLHRL